MDSGHIRFAIWAGASSAVAYFSATNFPALLSEDLTNNFGSIFPAIPFAALLTTLLALRWNDLHEVLKKEMGLKTEIPTRIIGITLVISLIALRGYTGLFVESAGVALVATFYGVSLALNPLTKRIMFPYTVIYCAGITSPAILEWALGGPLVSMSTVLSANFVSLTGISIMWKGSEFTLLSKAGGTISAVVTPGCSSVISITTFLGLLALMHLDLRKDISSTMKMAVIGVGVLIALNTIRIVTLILVGYLQGASMLWSVHNWVGYALFIGFYLVTLLVYPTMGKKAKSQLSLSK